MKNLTSGLREAASFTGPTCDDCSDSPPTALEIATRQYEADHSPEAAFDCHLESAITAAFEKFLQCRGAARKRWWNQIEALHRRRRPEFAAALEEHRGLAEFGVEAL